MKTLFLVDGAAGTGKSDLLHYIVTKKRQVATFVPKYTTRHRRRDEIDRNIPLDLRFPAEPSETFRKRTQDPSFYWYPYGKKGSEEYYGVYQSEIRNALADRDVVVLIIRDIGTIKSIKRDFPEVQCISVFVYSDRDLVVQRLRDDGYTEEEIGFRLDRQPLSWRDYVKYSGLYDDKLINSSDTKDFELLVEALFERWTSHPEAELVLSPTARFRLVTPLVGFKQRIEARLRKYPYDRNVFLMMKFRPGKNDRVYRFIERTLRENDFNCVRADQQEWDITRNAYNAVAVLYSCKYGIALFDEPEPRNEYSANVAYELGMMHEQGKDCLILRHKGLSEIPFDLVKELYVDYEDNLELEDHIKAWVGKIASEKVNS